MDLGGKLEELNLSRDEMQRFAEALKDDTFRELLSEYAAEISDPENRRRYEEEIAQLERDRGSTVRFLHPEAHHVLKTRSARDKCFINICSNRLIDTPACEAATDRDGRPGHSWRLPYSLTPGRADRDAAGRACVVYDAIFHPDALRMAEKDARLMTLVHDTAVAGIRDSFRVDIDKGQIKRLKMRYKGAPHPAVIRRPIPGHERKQSACEDGLAFPYPDQSPTEPAGDTTSTQPIKPHYTLKYRSVVDLQDYRCSRDSGPRARPAQIILTVDLPLLRSADDAELSVEERRLVLETCKPQYKLELLLSYPVEEDKGDAKFNKTRKQLTITLQVRPAELQQIRGDEMKTLEDTENPDPEPDGKADDPQTEASCEVLTGQQTDASAIVQPTEPDHSRHIPSVEVDSDPSNAVQGFHIPGVSKLCPPADLNTPAVTLEDLHQSFSICGGDEARFSQEPNTLTDAVFPDEPSMHQSETTAGERPGPSLTQQQETEMPKTDGVPEPEMDNLAFQNSLCFSLD